MQEEISEPGSASTADAAARDVASGIAFQSAGATSRLAVRCGAFADLGVICRGGF